MKPPYTWNASGGWACEFGQGYFFSKPLEVEQADELLKQQSRRGNATALDRSDDAEPSGSKTLTAESSKDRFYWLTRKSISVPLSNFTLLFVEHHYQPSGAFEGVDKFRFGIPTTPWVFPVIGGRALALELAGNSPSIGALGGGGIVPPPIVVGPPPVAIPPPCPDG